MPGTIMIHGSDGEVMAQLGSPGEFFRGKWVNVKITEVCSDEDVPLAVREALVGAVIPTIFTIEQIKNQAGTDFDLQPDARLAYASDVIDFLKNIGKEKEVNLLKSVAPSELDMYVLRPGTFTIL